MVETLKDWKGREIRIERSGGGKISVCNYEDNLIIPPNSLWPHPDIVKKLYRSNRPRAFDNGTLKKLKKKKSREELRQERIAKHVEALRESEKK